MEQLTEKGIPQPRILVPALLVLSLLVVLFFALPTLAPSNATIQFTLQASDGTPVPDAAVTLTFGQKQMQATSDSRGFVTFKDVPQNQKLQLSIHATGFTDETPRITYEQTIVKLRSSPAPSSFTFSAQVLNDQRLPLTDAQVRFSPDSGTAFLGVTDSFGEAQTTFSGALRVVVDVSKDGFKSQRKSVILSDQKNVEIILEKTDAQASVSPPASPFLLISVSDDGGNAVQGVNVVLVDSETQTVFRSLKADSSGQARFDRLDVNMRFSVSISDPQHRYGDYASPYPISAGPDPVSVTLSPMPPNDQLVLLVKDKSGNALSDATVSAYDSTRHQWITSTSSDASGKAALSVAAPQVRVIVYLDGYLPNSFTAKNKESRSVVLESTAGKTVRVNVSVQKNLDPAPQAAVQLFSSDGFPLGVPDQTTESDGTAFFDVPKSSNSIYAKASLDSSIGQSDRAVSQNDISWVISLLPPRVPFTVHAIDAVSLKPVNGATVRFITTAEKATCTTTNGTCKADVPAESEFRLVLESPSYLPYQSSPQLLGPDSNTQTYEAKLYPKSLTQTAVVSFQGFFTDEGKALRETSNAQPVVARFLVSLPSASAADTARFAVRLADSPQPVAAITSVDGTDTFFTGSDPQGACNPPLSDNESENAQWTVFDFAKGFSGTQQVAVHFFMNPTAKAPSMLWIQYDLHGLRKSVPFLYPLDSEKLQQLVSQSSIEEKDFCGQKSVSQRLAVSRDVLSCQDQYCVKSVFIASDGVRMKDSAQLMAGSPFGLDLSLIGLKSGISSVQISAPNTVQLVSFQPQVGTTAGNQTLSTFESIATNSIASTNSLALALVAVQNAKADMHLEAQALRATALAEIKVSIQDTDGIITDFSRNIIIRGTNRISATTSLESLDASVTQNLRIVLKDQFNKPVTDAAVELYECDGSPLNGQELQPTDSNNGAGGAYLFQKLQPSGIGTIGIRVNHPQFQPFEECSLPVRSTDFLTAEPQSLILKGDTKKETVSEKITLSSLLDVKSSVSSTIKCTDANGTDVPSPFTLSPKAFSLKETATINVQALKQSFSGSCQITFIAKINKDNLASAVVSVEADLKGPPRPDQLCPTAQTGVKCMASAEATSLRCTKNTLLCDDATMFCYQCNLGPQTLPSSISLSVSNYQSDDSQTYAIALDDNPDECRVEGFTNNPASAPYGYNNPNAANPYGYQPGYSAPNSYYAYQSNPYTPYSTNPFMAPGSCLPYGANLGGVGGLSGSVVGIRPGYPATYPSGYTGTNGYYPGAPGVVPGIPNAANPATAAANCQTIISKLSPQCQVYFTQNNAYNTNQNFYGQSYRDPWANNLNPGFQQSNAYQYPQNRPTVRVQADCTRTEIKMTAQYPGGDAQYAGQLGGNQQGYLMLRTGGQTKQIPITVVVQTPFTPGGYPGGNYPSGFPSNQIPPQCILEYQQVLVQTQATTQTPQEGLDESGLPDTVDVYYNRYSGEGVYERELKPPAGGTLALVRPTSSQVKLDVSGNKLRVNVKCTRKTKDADFDCPSDVTFKATWNFVNIQSVQKERTIHLVSDDFQPAAIQLLIGNAKKDAALFDVSSSGDFAKAKCKETAGVHCQYKDGTVSAESASDIKNARLYVSGLGDYQIRSIPVSASTIEPSVILDAGEEKVLKFSTPLLVKPTCAVENEKGSDLEKNLDVTCTLTEVKLIAKAGLSVSQKGYVTIIFDESARKDAKDNYKPSISVGIVPTSVASSEIYLNPNGDKHVVGEAFNLNYKFPKGDDVSKREVSTVFTPTGGTAQNPVVLPFSKLTDSSENGGTLALGPYDRPGKLEIVAKTQMPNSKDVRMSGTVMVTIQNPPAPAQTPQQPPGPGQNPPSTGDITIASGDHKVGETFDITLTYPAGDTAAKRDATFKLNYDDASQPRIDFGSLSKPNDNKLKNAKTSGQVITTSGWVSGLPGKFEVTATGQKTDGSALNGKATIAVGASNSGGVPGSSTSSDVLSLFSIRHPNLSPATTFSITQSDPLVVFAKLDVAALKQKYALDISNVQYKLSFYTLNAIPYKRHTDEVPADKQIYAESGSFDFTGFTAVSNKAEVRRQYNPGATWSAFKAALRAIDPVVELMGDDGQGTFYVVLSVVKKSDGSVLETISGKDHAEARFTLIGNSVFPTDSTATKIGLDKYDVLIVKTDWNNYPAAKITIKGHDYNLRLKYVTDSINHFADSNLGVYVAVEDTDGSAWNCAGFFQTGKELYLDKSHKTETCYTSTAFRSSAYVKMTLKMIVLAKDNALNPLWSGYRRASAQLVVEPA